MVPYNVLNDLHIFIMRCIDKILICEIGGLVTHINSSKVECMVAVVVITGGICYNRGNPNCREAKCLDVIKLIGKTFEISAPCGVFVGVTCLGVIPAMNVVACVAVIETGCDDKVD